MFLFHNIGERINSNYNTREEVLTAKGPISFDGIYLNVYENRDVLVGKDVTLFVMGGYVGLDNSFDLRANPNIGLKLEKYCNWPQIFELKEKYGCKLAWHTWTHRNLGDLKEEGIRMELFRPPNIDPILAYPHGTFNEQIIEIAKDMGYTEAWSVTQGDGSAYQRKRKYCNW
jgi:hypothetical protein